VKPDDIEDIAKRFAGLDIQYRPGPGGWGSQWRVRQIASKNERADYRIIVYGATMDMAMEALVLAIAALDAGDT
jgi:hypothetical protein